jgi:hypothetical protein
VPACNHSLTSTLQTASQEPHYLSQDILARIRYAQFLKTTDTDPNNGEASMVDLEQRRTSPQPHFSYYNTTASTAVHEPFLYDSQGQAKHQSPHIAIQESVHQTRRADHNHASGSIDLSLHPWVFENDLTASPLSRSSSLGGSDHAYTPPHSLNGSEYASTPPHVEQAPMYHAHSQPLFVENMDHLGWHNEHDQNWHSQFPGPDVWNEQHFTALWGGGNCDELPLPFYNATLPPPSMGHPTPLGSAFSQLSLETYPALQGPTLQSNAPTAFRSQSANGNGTDQESDESEDEEDENPRPGFSNSNRTTPTSVLQLGKWLTVDAYEPRRYKCPLAGEPSAGGHVCRQMFRRPEHLRRHVLTVHVNKRDHVCRVPMCQKGFSRGDNLRDHYWSHLDRGGRAGKNEKMSLDHLKVILGPKQKKLVRKLKVMLIKEMGKRNIKIKARL